MHVTIRFTILLLTALSFLLTGGCAGSVRMKDEPLALDVVGPVEIDVDSFNGDVEIRADPNVEQTTVIIEREAVHGHGRTDEAKQSLPQINYSVEIVPGELGPRLQVRTSTEHAEPHFQRANVHITVPEVEGVYVRTSNGRVYARGVQGPIDISTTNGDVRLMTRHPIRRAVTIINSNGDIDYRVRSESTGYFDGETVRGRVGHRVQYGRFVVHPGSGFSRLAARLNDGQNPITLRTSDGDIRIAVVSDPEAVGTFIFE